MSDFKKTGFYAKYPKAGAPDFVKGNISVKVDDAIAFLTSSQNEKGYVNLELLESRAGELYLKESNYKPAQTEAP